jgi:glycosyltransferase involved in cell wall biosynthesis
MALSVPATGRPKRHSRCLPRRIAGKAYGVEVLGDPRDVFAPGANDHMLRPLFRHVFQADLRRVVLYATAAAYVTDAALQRRYPCPAFQIGVSDVEIGEDALAPTWRRASSRSGTFSIVTVGSLENLCKGPDVLLEALAGCVARGLDVSLTLVGDGRHRPELEARSHALGLDGRVRFAGEVTAGAAVRRELDAADLFVLPSRAEGLPRALIEAMARGLPCLASRVGGIPELLTDDALVAAGDAGALAFRIATLLRRPEELDGMAAQNLARAADFRESLLVHRRRWFYREVLDRTRATHRLTHT